MNEIGDNFLDDALYLKRNNESLYLTILVSLSSKAEIKSQEKAGSLKKSHDKKEREVVSGGWHTKTKWQSSPIDGDAGAQSFRDKWRARGPKMKWKEILHTVNQDKKKITGSTVVKKVRRENQRSW